MTICHLLDSLQQLAQELLCLGGLPGLSPAVASQLVLGDGLADCSSRGILHASTDQLASLGSHQVVVIFLVPEEDTRTQLGHEGPVQWMGLATAAAGNSPHKMPDIKADLLRGKKFQLITATYYTPSWLNSRFNLEESPRLQQSLSIYKSIGSGFPASLYLIGQSKGVWRTTHVPLHQPLSHC